MNEENTEKLFKRFDFFYPETPITQSLMAFGFECGDGWFQLIWNLCENIEKELQKGLKKTDPKKRTKDLLRGAHKFRVSQVKEKFGTLRFYVDSTTDKIFKFIQKAENKSSKICESCGADADLVSKESWLATLCTDCARKENYKPVKRN